MWAYVHTDELYHHGIKGMKWGVRRYQNKDGSLTPAGRKRVDKGFKDARDLAETHARLEDTTRRLHRGWDGKSQILVPTDVKEAYGAKVDEFITKNSVMNKKYKSVFSEIITENGKDYVVTMLEDRVTGNGYESKVELHERKD